jgi:uncharacterized protein (TIGR02453 family)
VVGAAVFAGFPAAGFAFLEELGAHQDRAWFQEHKERYERDVRAPLAALVTALATELAERNVPLAGDPKHALFRIHRDVRFSRDKSPYNTHASAALTRNGDRRAPGVVYLHFDPTGSFAACGFFRPEPAALDAIRRAIVARPNRWHKALDALAEHELALAEDDDQLKRLPRGYESVAGSTVADAVLRKSFVVRMTLDRAIIGDAALVTRLAAFAEQAHPLLAFGWDALAA